MAKKPAPRISKSSVAAAGGRSLPLTALGIAIAVAVGGWLTTYLRSGQNSPLGPCASAVSARDRRKEVQYFSFNSSSQVVREQWQFAEAEGIVPDRFGPPTVLRLSPLLDRDNVVRLLASVKSLLYAEDDDSVDGLPTFQSVIIDKGQPVVPDNVMRELLPAIEQRLLPYARQRFACPDCVVCTAMVRRYVPGERREHPWHFDSQAMMTSVVSLSPRGSYVGGFYVQPDFDPAHRKFIDLEAGDAVLHSFDLLHGVEVLDGERVSLVIWLKPSEESCVQSDSPWYKGQALQGDARAQYNYGRMLAHGEGLEPKDAKAGFEWYRKAAEQGYVLAMYNIATALHHGRGTERDLSGAAKWYANAATAGHPKAMANWGTALVYGLGGTKKNATLAASWLQKSALMGTDVAMFQLGRLLVEGVGGVVQDTAEAACWFADAARQDHPDAKKELAKLQKRA